MFTQHLLQLKEGGVPNSTTKWTWLKSLPHVAPQPRHPSCCISANLACMSATKIHTSLASVASQSPLWYVSNAAKAPHVQQQHYRIYQNKLSTNLPAAVADSWLLSLVLSSQHYKRVDRTHTKAAKTTRTWLKHTLLILALQLFPTSVVVQSPFCCGLPVIQQKEHFRNVF